MTETTAGLVGPTAGRGGSMGVYGTKESSMVMAVKREAPPTADLPVSPLQKAQGRCLALADGLTGAVKWRMMR